MDYTRTNEGVEHKPERTPADQLRYLERISDFKAEDWHFKLLQQGIDAQHVKSFFGNAILKGGTLWFNGSSKNGIFCYDWVKQKFLMEMQRALGDINLALAVDRVIVKQFSLVPPKRTVTPQTKQTVAQVCGKLVAGL